jgi:hypothetical protein
VVTTDGQGRYAIFDVRPGNYSVTFTAEGFNTVKRELEVPSNVTVNVSVSLVVGSVAQTLEVQAAAPSVDVENVAHPAILSLSDMDALPSARYMQSMGSYVPGVHLDTPDIADRSRSNRTTCRLTEITPPIPRIYSLRDADQHKPRRRPGAELHRQLHGGGNYVLDQQFHG